MGLFGFLKSFGKEKEIFKEVNNSIPTITPEKEIFDCYEEVFKREIANVSGISQSDVAEIYKLISQSEGGFLNMGAYHTPAYEKYFKGKDWAWTEYDEWNERFTKLGRFPISFPKKVGAITPETALGLFTVADLKNLLKENNIEFSSKAKKPDLIELAKEIADIGNQEKIKVKIAEELEKEKHSIYTILMRTINFRGKSLYDHNRAKSAGIKKFEINHTHESDKEFYDMALKKNPNALPPLYPYDLSFLTPIIDFDD